MRFLLFGLLYFMLLSTNVFAQDDPIDLVRTYPPEMLSEKQATTGMGAIKWQLEQKQSLLQAYQLRLDQWKKEVLILRHVIEDLKSDLSPEIRILDKDGRSRLVGKLMEERIDGALEMATRKKAIELLEREDTGTMSPQSKFQKSDLEGRLKVAGLKLNTAEAEAEEVAKLASKGYKTQSEGRMAAYTREIAQLEFEAVRNQLVLQSNEGKVESAKRIADERVQLEPIKARMMAADLYLNKFTTKVDVIEKIEVTKRSVSMWEKDIQILVKKVVATSSELDELQQLNDRVEERLKNVEKIPTSDDSSFDKPFKKK